MSCFLIKKVMLLNLVAGDRENGMKEKAMYDL